MDEHLTESRLNDYLDGLLAGPAEQMVEEHLEACAACREALEANREVIDRVRELPAAIRPRRDLWDGIEAATRPVRPLWSGASPSAADRRWRRPALLATAAAVLVAVTATVTFLLVQATSGTPSTVATAPQPTSAAALAVTSGEFAATEAEHLRTTARMIELLDDRREALAPETRQAIDASLRDIDTAIQRLREALAADPASAELIHMLDDAYRWKIDVLRRAIRASQS